MKRYYIPENKFPIKLHDHIYMLGNYYFNLYLIKGSKKVALFEVGISAITDTVIAQLKKLDITPDYIIPSHPHSDHITGLPGLRKQYAKAQVILAQGAKEFIAHPKAQKMILDEDKIMSSNLAKFKIKPGRSPLEAVPKLDDVETIKNESYLDLGNIALQLTKMGGHSPGNLIGTIKEINALFCSDSIGFHFPGRHFLPLFFTSADEYISTLQYIIDLQPTILCPAHQGPLIGTAAKQSLDKTWNTTLEAIRKIKLSILPDEDLAKQIFEKNYKDEFTLYSKSNIQNCSALIVKRAKEANLHE